MALHRLGDGLLALLVAVGGSMQALHIADRKGSLGVGMDADLVMLTDDLRVQVRRFAFAGFCAWLEPSGEGWDVFPICMTQF